MKQTVLTLIIALTTITVSANDRVIVNPVYEFSNTGITHITRIELGNNETRLHVHTIFLPGWWTKFPTMTFIEDCDTGERWQAIGIINGEFDKEIYMPASGDSIFVLIFPPLDKSVTKINFSGKEDTNVPEIFGISLDPETQPRNREIPAVVLQWINSELGKAKRKSLMDFEIDEFFDSDTARLIGYINGYDPRAGFSTGMVYASNSITREDYPVVIKIHEDGRFEGAIPINYPEYLYASFNRSAIINFYIQPGQMLAVMLDWDEFLMADRLRNAPYKFKNPRYQGATADINKELFAFSVQLPELPVRKIYEGMAGKSPDEFISFYRECMSDYSSVHQRLLETEELSEMSKNILQNNYLMMYATYLFEYEMSNRGSQMPLEFYDFLQDIPMNNKELLSTQNFSTFINRLEYCQPFRNTAIRPEKTYAQYLFEELEIPKTPDDEEYLLMVDSLNIVPSNLTREFFERMDIIWEKFIERHGQEHYEAYKTKYEDAVRQLTQVEIGLARWRIKDTILTNNLKLEPGIVYDVTKIRSLDFMFRQTLKDSKDDAWTFLTALTSDIPEQFLKKEADRLFIKNFPTESQNEAYELPDTYEAKIFKELIAPSKGKILLVDFWATSCGPCISNIRQQKTLREKYKNSPDVAFVFITSEKESPSNAYDFFVDEQELTNTYRISADQFQYLRQLFRFNGIPRYVLVDKEGKIVDDNFMSHNFERWLQNSLY